MTDLKINTYPMHIGDWHSGTSRMSCCEAGVYIRLCNQYYLDQGRGWTVNECLRICAAMAKDEQKAVKSVLASKFEQVEGGYRHAGMDKRISEIVAASERNQERARIAAEKRWAREKQCLPDAMSIACSMPGEVLEECHPKAKSQKPVIEDDDVSAGASDFGDWPEPRDTVGELTRAAGIPPADWQLHTVGELTRWRMSGLSFRLDVVPAVTAVWLKVRQRPPKSWAYFTDAIAQHHANRLTPIAIPEAQHERHSQPYRTAGQRNQDSTIAAFQRVFGGATDGEKTSIHSSV